MKKNLNKDMFFAVITAFLLKRITYAIGGFNFSNAPLFSLYSLYDLIILLIYSAIIQYVINKIRAKKDQNKEN